MMSSTSKSGITSDNDDHDHDHHDPRRVTMPISDDEEENATTASASASAATATAATTTIKYPQWHNAVAGGLAGAGARLFTAPLDLIRIRAQLERRDIYPRPSILTRMTNVYKAEGGITALFRGNLAASYLWIGYTMVQFSVYGTIKERLEDYRDNKQQLSNLLANPAVVAFLSGGGAGVCATITTYPFDICRTVFASRGALTQQQQQQYQHQTHASSTSTATATSTTFRPPSTIKECAKSMYRQHGIKGFYAGAAPAVVQIVPYMGLNFAIYDFLITQGEQERSKSIGLSGYAGSISGAVSKTIVYPIDTVKKRIQIQSVFGAASISAGGGGGGGGGYVVYKYNGMWDCLATTIRTEGVHGLYRGLFTSVLKTTMGSGLAFTFFRSTKNLLENLHDY